MIGGKDGLTVRPNGDKQWHLNDKLHRVDGPALERNKGDISWYLHGKLHREDGPAIEWPDGTREWFVNGIRHRVGGPAVLTTILYHQYAHGEQHRADGPAIVWYDGMKEWNKHWFLIGKKLSEELHHQLTGNIKELPLYLGRGFDDFIEGRLKDEG